MPSLNHWVRPQSHSIAFCQSYSQKIDSVFTKTTFLRSFRSTPGICLASLTIRHFAPKTKNYKAPRANVAPPEVPAAQKIAVVGGGLAGLAVIYHLFNSTARYAKKRGVPNDDFTVTLFDPITPGSAPTSSAAAGLLHPYRPRPKNKMWEHQKGMDASLHLLSIAEAASQKLFSTTGLLKLALDDRSLEDFQIAARRFPHEVEFLQPDQLSDRYPHVSPNISGLLIQNAHVVRTVPYMKALWNLSYETGRLSWSQSTISSVSELFDGGYDNVVLCPGAAVKDLTDVHKVPIIPCLGRNLVMQSSSPLPPTPLLAGAYVVPAIQSAEEISENALPHLTKAIVGATFEYNFSNPLPSPDIPAIKTILSERVLKIQSNLYDEWTVQGTQTGIRAIPPRKKEGAIPIACKVDGTPPGRFCWLFTGLGGRGLLYHAFLGRCIAHSVIAGTDKHIPSEAKGYRVTFSSSYHSNNIANELNISTES